MDICMLCSDCNNIYDYLNFVTNYAVETGETKYLEQCIKKYYNLFNKSHIEMANNIMFEITQEKLENMDIS